MLLVRPKLWTCLGLLLAVGSLVAAWPAVVWAEGEPADYTSRPVAVVTLPGYDSLLKNVGFIGKLVDRPALPEMIEGGLAFFTGGNGLAGLDKSRSLGFIIQLNAEDQPEPLGFIPVTDLKKLLSSFEGLTGGALKPDDDGIYSVEAGRRPVYIQEKAGWAFLARKPELLKNTPADPLKLLGGLEKDYNLGVRIYVQNVPQKVKERAKKELEEGLQAGLKRMEKEDEQEYESRKKIAENSFKQMIRLVKETEQVTLGWKLDTEAGTSHLDLSVIALPGTKLAAQSKELSESKSKFTGFLLDDGAIKGTLSFKMTDKEEIANLVAMADAARVKIMQKIDKDEGLPDDAARAKAKEIVGELIDVARDTLAEGALDAGGVMRVVPGQMTVALGGVVADGAKLEATLRKLADAAKEHGDFKGVEWDVEKYEGVSFHRLHLPVQDDKEKQVLGDPMEMLLGIGEHSFYLSFGKANLETLKQVIDKSKSMGDAAVPPMQAAVSVGKLVRFAAEQNDDPTAKAIGETLSGDNPRDHVRITVRSIEGGMLYRLELEQGVLKAIGKAVNAGMGRMDRGL